MKNSHFLFSAIAVILSMSMIFSCTKPEEQQKTDPTPPPTPKEAVVIDSGVDTKPTIKQEGGEAKVSFTATENWTASIINTKADSWISLDKTSGSAGNVTITITVQGNDTPDDRSATVQIKAGNTTIDIVVSQKGKDSLTTTASKNEFGPEGGELTIEVKANIDFTYSIAEGCKDWISESGTKAMTTTTLKFKIAENEDVAKREGSITIKSSLGEEVIRIYQSGTEPTIVITKNEYSVKAEGETIQVEVSSNVNVEMAIPDDCDWIKEETTKAVSTNTFYLNVLENTSLDSRTAKVAFKNVENGLSEEITVTQAGRDAVHVESISLDKTELGMTEGGEATLVATVLPENADNKKVIWSSSDDSVATVKDGVVTAIKEGSATITAKTEDGEKAATCSVTVIDKSRVKALSFTADGEQSISLINNRGNAPSLQYSYDGNNWTDWDYSALTFGANNKSVFIRGNNPNGISKDYDNYSRFRFSTDAKVQCDGNIMHLLSFTEDLTEIPSDYCYYGMFLDCTSLVSAPALPATTLAEWCYEYMFRGCTSLVNAPELPATSLASACYGGMFLGCTSLVNAPELPATSLASACYDGMFLGCTSLVNAPELPATSLAFSCYSNMFSGCTSLVSAPALPATNVAKLSYDGMFLGCTSLVNAPELPATSLASTCYNRMFSGCTSLVNAPELPATTLDASCYVEMFSGCTSLINAPELPATTLAEWCYDRMFSGCTSLVSAPELPATTLTTHCYGTMFYGCTSLVSAPELPATTLTNCCYSEMFYGCTSLVSAPELPATTLISACYDRMFRGCTSLEIAPELPATTLAEGCYDYMFYGCEKLNYVKASFTTTPSSDYTSNWLSGVSSTGTFVKSKDATWDVRGTDGIPEGWTVETETETQTEPTTEEDLF